MRREMTEKFTSDETAVFCSQMAMLLGGGISLYEGTDMLCAEMEKGEMKTTLEGIDSRLKDGMAFYQALEESQAFPQYMVRMVQVGESTGKLEETLKALAAYYERENTVNIGIKSVFLYPTMLFIMMAAILTILVTIILPMFASVFEELDNKTSSTQTLMNTSLIGSRILTVIVLAIVVVIIAILVWYRISKGDGAFSTLLRILPFTRKLTDKLNKGKFFAALSTMVSGGMETDEAVERASGVLEDNSMIAKTKNCKELLKAGEKFDTALCKSNILSGMQGRMVGVGVKSGKVDLVLERLSKRYDEEIDENMGKVLSHVEAILVVALSLTVGLILIAVMLPLMSVIASI